jgi:heat shock protein HspQ
MAQRDAKFRIGDIIHHKRFDYLGAIFDVDPIFAGSDEWYEQMARSRPPKDAPWYHVLVDHAAHTTYVAEQNLESADVTGPIRHELIDHYFGEFDGERYVRRGGVN